MKYLHKGGYVSTYTREEMEKRDRDEGRIRMPAVCITAIIGLGGAVCLWDWKNSWMPSAKEERTR